MLKMTEGGDRVCEPAAGYAGLEHEYEYEHAHRFAEHEHVHVE